MISSRIFISFLIIFIIGVISYTLLGRQTLSNYVPQGGKPAYPKTYKREWCENILDNMTNGQWIRKVDVLTSASGEEFRELVKKEAEFDAHIAEYRIKRGIHLRLWRDDLKCGDDNFQKKPPGSHWMSVSAWCDAKSDNPCCSDEKNGTCGTNCGCPSCIDMRKIYHSEFSNWVTSDSRCKMRNYTAGTACDVVKRFSEIYFVGDSYVRKMARGFILLLRSDPTYGAVAKRYKNIAKKLCVGPDQFYWPHCDMGEGGFDELMTDDAPLCGINLKHFSYFKYHNIENAKQFLDLVKKLAGKEKTVINLGVGAHNTCNAPEISEKYLGPAFSYLKTFYQNRNMSGLVKWPLIIFMTPDTPGLLKARAFRHLNGKLLCYKFAEEITEYCKSFGISVLDFRKLTTGIHSYDGSHHGLGLNLMKNQMLLNYLDSISKPVNGPLP